MAVNPNWPFTVTSFSTANPFDGSAPAFVDVSSRVRQLASSAGRQYELDTVEAGEARLVIDDKDEAFNPTNSSSPYYPNVKPYRQLTDQAMWPPVPNGAAVNLLNATSGYDPTFEGYAANGSLPWVAGISSTPQPTISTTSPFAGTKCISTTLPAATGQGVGVTVPCIPGQPYTFSAYVQVSASNSIQISVFNGATGSTSTPTAYTLMSITFIASATTHQIRFLTTGTVTAATLRVDNVQHEPVQPLNANSGFDAGTANWTVFGGTMAMSSAWAQGGTSSVMLTPDGVSTSCYVESDAVAVVPGQTYAAAGWVYSQTAWSNVSMSANWYNSSRVFISTSSATFSVGANTYGPHLATYTAPAGAAYGTVLGSVGGTPPATQKTWFDQVMLVSATPSAFATTGPTVYGVFSGFVERWPSSWLYQGTFGQAQITAVDALAVLRTHSMRTEYANAVLAKNPSYYWPLGEGQGATSFADISGNGGTPLTLFGSKYGLATTPPAPGTATNIPGDPGGTGVALTQGVAAGGNSTGTILGCGPLINTPAINIGSQGALGFGVSVAFWVTITNPRTAEQDTLMRIPNNAQTVQAPRTFPPDSNTTLAVMVNADGTVTNSGVVSVSSTARIDDGKPHLIYAAQNADATGTLKAILVVDSASYSHSIAGTNSGVYATSITVGGYFDAASFSQAVGGTISHLAVWNGRLLSSGEISDLQAAGGGYSGEGPGARISRYLSYGWTGPTTIDTGASTMGVSSLSGKSSMLDACQTVSTTENGRFLADPSGRLVFQARTAQYFNLTPKWVFGENEIPYEHDIQYDYDPTLVYNDVKVTQNGGIAAVGGTPSAVQASVQAFGTHSFSRTVNTASANEAQDAANWIFLGHSQPAQRIARLAINPAANPALWPVALGARIGDRVTVKRRTSAGYMMQADYFIERIEHSRASGAWTVSFQMSPASTNVVTPWILGDSTYGVLDTTTIPAY